jgi:hypothetical protein
MWFRRHYRELMDLQERSKLPLIPAFAGRMIFGYNKATDARIYFNIFILASVAISSFIVQNTQIEKNKLAVYLNVLFLNPLLIFKLR